MNATRSPKSASSFRPFANRFVAILLFVFAGYLIADLGTLYSREYMLPTQPPPGKPKMPVGILPPGNFQNVATRNMFNSDGVIPQPLSAKAGRQRQELPPVKSQLPLTLVGTLVHSNPEKSLASLEVRGKNQILTFRPKQEIEKLATLERVERMKVFIRNSNTGALEFIEMKDMPKMALRTARPEAGGGDVKKVGENEFEMKREDLLKYTADLSSILMQARAVPARRGGNGDIYGFRLVEIQPNSIYTQLGLQTMDTLTCVNGTPVTSPQQALELYSTLRSASSIQLCVERNGQNQDLKYRIR